jgi:hypothetical protein
MARVVTALAVAVILCLAATPAASAPPQRGLFVTGKSMGGVSIGMTKAQVVRAWGERHGVCRRCPRTTWYFNYRPFEPQGAGVVFLRGRVVRAFTVWQPRGWRTASGLTLGDEAGRIGELEGPFLERDCGRYTALVVPTGRVQTIFYVYEERLWGFGLARTGATPCVVP